MRPIFRKKALDTLSSPEQLDQLMQVTTLRGWVALLGLGILLVAGITYAFLGNIPSTITEQGVLLNRGGVRGIVVPVAGELIDVSVQVGDDVKAGQIVAVLHEQSSGNDTPIISSFSGRVLDVQVTPNMLVERGTNIAIIEPEGDELNAVVYLSFEEGKTVTPGMRVQLEPVNVSREAHGLLLGEVRRVAPLPATRASMMRTLGNETLVDSFLERGAQIEVLVDLQRDPSTPSGYAWSTPSGPPFELGSSTPATASFIVSEQPPISLIFPPLD